MICFYCGKNLGSNQEQYTSEDGIIACQYECSPRRPFIPEEYLIGGQKRPGYPEIKRSPAFSSTHRKIINKGSCDQCGIVFDKIPGFTKTDIIKGDDNDRKFCCEECRNLWYGIPDKPLIEKEVQKGRLL